MPVAAISWVLPSDSITFDAPPACGGGALEIMGVLPAVLAGEIGSVVEVASRVET